MSSSSKRSKSKLLVGIILSAGLALSACSSAEDDPQGSGSEASDVNVSYEITDSTQEISIDGDLTGSEPAAWVFHEGTGDAVEEDALLEIFVANVDIENEEVLAEDFTAGGSTLAVSQELAAGNPQLYDALLGAPLGSDVAFYLPPNTLEENDPAYFNVLHISRAIPTRIEGERVAPEELDERLPEITFDEETSAPLIAKPEGEAPVDLIVDVLVEGDGPEIEPGAQVMVHYRGVLWSDGEEFDSSWGPDNTGTPASFPLDGLITAWTEGLPGLREGSRIALVTPPEKGYGEHEGHEYEHETLVFVIDILHTSPSNS